MTMRKGTDHIATLAIRLFLAMLALFPPVYTALVLWPAGQYLDHDTLIYAIVGKYIFTEWSLPYDVVFDHKPVLTYFLYGPLALVRAAGDVYALFSLAWVFLTAVVAHRLLLRRAVPFPVVFFLLYLSAILSTVVSANTAVIYVCLDFLAIGLLFRANGRRTYFAGSALAAVAAINVNYVAAPPLALALLYALHATSGDLLDFVRRALAYLVASLLWLTGLFALLAVIGMDVAGYFDLQAQFLGGYDNYRNILDPYYLRCAVFALLCLALPFLPFLTVPAGAQPVRMALALLALLSLAAEIVAGRYWDHYLHSIMAPALIALLLPDYGSARLRVASGIALAGALAFAVSTLIAKLPDPEARRDLYASYAPIANAAAGAPVMPMHAELAPYYFSGVRPAANLIFYDVVKVMHGPGADGYYLENLRKNPELVMTSFRWCDDRGADFHACSVLKARYDEVLGAPEISRIETGYSLYRLKPDQDG